MPATPSSKETLVHGSAAGAQYITIFSAAFVLVVFLSSIRAIILLDDLIGRTAGERATLLIVAVLADTLVAIVISLIAALLVSLGGQSARRGIAGILVAIANLLLLWGLGNIAAVHMLGEPVTADWLRYSDIFNSTFIFDSLLHIARPETILIALAIVALYNALTFALTRMLGGPGKPWAKALVFGLPMVIALAGLALKGDANRAPGGKLSNPAMAFAWSFFSGGRLTSESISGGQPSLSALSLAMAAPVERPEVAKGQLKNVLIFIFESTSVKYMAGFEPAYAVTPNVDRHLGAGFRFRSIYAHTPASNFFLVSLAAALVPEMSAYSMTYSYPDLRMDSIADVLKARGYRTGHFSSSDNRFQGQGEFMARSGFETVKDYRDWSCSDGLYEFKNTVHKYLDTSNDRCTARSVIEWIAQDDTRPFLLTVRTGMTHYPYFTGANPRAFAEDENLNRYLNAISVADEAFGMVMDDLARSGKLDSTLVVILGDHGEAFGEHGNYVHAAALYEENLHIPLILISPSIFHGGSADVVGGVSDIAPTVLDLMGIRVPPLWQGRSLFAPGRTDAVLFFAPWNGFQVGFREGSRKFMFNANTSEAKLFDLATDPLERVDLAAARPEEVELARKTLAAWVGIQQAWIGDYLRLSGADRKTIEEAPRNGGLVVRATGTRFKTPPRALVLLDGATIGEFEIANAPSNARAAASDEQVDRALTAFTIPVDPPKCAKRLEIRFLNDEWAGEGKTGDTDLYLREIELAGHKYGPERIELVTDRAGGPRREYFTLWRTGSAVVNLDVGSECVASELAGNSGGEPR